MAERAACGIFSLRWTPAVWKKLPIPAGRPHHREGRLFGWSPSTSVFAGIAAVALYTRLGFAPAERVYRILSRMLQKSGGDRISYGVVRILAYALEANQRCCVKC